MDEKIIIKSAQYNVKKLFAVFLIFGAILSGMLYLSVTSGYAEWYDEAYETSLKHTNNGERKCSSGRFNGIHFDPYGECRDCETVAEKSKLAFIIESVNFDERSDDAFIPLAAALIIGGSRLSLLAKL